MSVQFKDYYEVLGVTKSTPQDEIRKAFRKLARQYHPDVVKPKEKVAAEAKFKEINEAYEVLGDPEKRQKYDRLGVDWERGSAPSGRRGGGEEFHFGGTGFSDFFEQFFGGSRPRSNSFSGGFSPTEPTSRGRDIEADILVTIEEVLKGSRRKISFQRSANGNTETYEVRIPEGVCDGQKIRLVGQGHPGVSEGKSGDLFLRVKFAQHPEFRVEGSDLVHEQILAPWQAVLGGEVSVPTLEGRARLKIPAGTQQGQRFRLKQQGLLLPTKTRGNLYVVVQVEIPKILNSRERELWQELAVESRK